LWSRRAIGLHVALLLAVPSFLTLGYWQLDRALKGNVLSWAYTFEWPFFAAYATWMWWKLLHTEPAGETGRYSKDGGDERVIDTYDPYDESDPELAAYNRYLAELNKADKPKTW